MFFTSPISNSEDSDNGDIRRAGTSFLQSRSLPISKSATSDSSIMSGSNTVEICEAGTSFLEGGSGPFSKSTPSDSSSSESDVADIRKAGAFFLQGGSHLFSKSSPSDCSSSSGSDLADDREAVRSAAASFFGDGSQGINELPNGDDYSSISSSSSTVDDDGANVHAAAESFFANADVIETLYPGLDTDNYDEAIAAAAQDFINASDIV